MRDVFASSGRFGDNRRVDFWAEVEHLESVLAEVSYFDLLGVNPDAVSQGAILTDAYHAALRRFHPDRHAVGSSASQREALARICARVGESYRVLSSPTRRAEYEHSLETGEPLERTKRATVRETRDPKGEKARALLASGLQLLAKGNAAGALAKIELALQFEPESEALGQAREQCAPAEAPADDDGGAE